MPSIEWVKPSPLWASPETDFVKPQLIKLSGDQFLPEFLEAMQGKLPTATPAAYLADPSRAFLAPEDGDEKGLRLYHPAHGRYYLVTASLVCRQLGLPDRSVALQDGESISFVVRRRIPPATNGSGQLATVEQGWVDEGPQRGWRDLVDARGLPVAVRPDEERFRLHPVTVNGITPANGARRLNGTATSPQEALDLIVAEQRRVYYGYIAVGNRDKYLDRRPVQVSDPDQALADYVAAVRDESSLESTYDFRLDQVSSRVLDPWRGIYTAPDEVDQLKGKGEARLGEFSLYLILDLADWLNSYLPEVFKAITGGTTLPAGSKRQALLKALQDINIKVRRPGAGSEISLGLDDAIAELANRLGLVHGEGEEPADRYNVRDADRPKSGGGRIPLSDNKGSYLSTFPTSGPLHKALAEALVESPSPAAVPEEVITLLQSQVVIDRSDQADAPPQAGQLFVRLVYERPGCPPLVSQESDVFTLAKYFDPDAPARPIRIELPSIAMKDLRKYKRGVGLQMSPELRDVMNRINKDMLDGGGLSDGSVSWELGMICSFSLQIIFLVAFIVMFIFLISLNFIFWWLPFLKICFPIPVKKS